MSNLAIYLLYEELKDEFYENMGIDEYQAQVQNNLDDYFCIDSDTVHYQLDKFNNTEEASYSSTIRKNIIKRKDNLVLVLIEDTFGGKDYFMLFDSSKEIPLC